MNSKIPAREKLSEVESEFFGSIHETHYLYTVRRITAEEGMEKMHDALATYQRRITELWKDYMEDDAE